MFSDFQAERILMLEEELTKKRARIRRLEAQIVMWENRAKQWRDKAKEKRRVVV